MNLQSGQTADGTLRAVVDLPRDRQLVIHFGPFPLFRRRIWYKEIVDAEQGRTTLLDGWGIHWTPWSGWVWNIWGFDCVVLRLKKGTLKVGTDDPDGLVEFLKTQMS